MIKEDVNNTNQGGKTVKSTTTSDSKRVDRIEGDKIILYDDSGPGSRVIKTVEIFNSQTGRRTYRIKKTKNNGYLFN